MENNTINNDEELIKAFVGPNYDKIKNESFNIWAFLFAPFYMFYRKMILFALLTILLNLFLGLFIPFASIITGLIAGFLVNKLYLSFARDKVNKIKLSNPNKNLDELKKICELKGGVSSAYLIVAIIGTFWAVVLFMIIFGSILMILMSNRNVNNIFNQVPYYVEYYDMAEPGINYYIYITDKVKITEEHLCSDLDCKNTRESYTLNYSQDTINNLKQFLKDNFGSNQISVSEYDLTNYQKEVIKALIAKNEYRLKDALKQNNFNSSYATAYKSKLNLISFFFSNKLASK